MSRHLIAINSTADRERVARYAAVAPFGTRVEFKASKRTLPQNDRMWAMLTDIAKQKDHCGRKYTPDLWKCIFMHALGQEVQFIPSLDEKSFIPLGYHSSDLSKAEMSGLIEFMMAWGTQNGVQFHDPEGLSLMASERAAAPRGKPSGRRGAKQGSAENTAQAKQREA